MCLQIDIFENIANLKQLILVVGLLCEAHIPKYIFIYPSQYLDN